MTETTKKELKEKQERLINLMKLKYTPVVENQILSLQRDIDLILKKA